MDLCRRPVESSVAIFKRGKGMDGYVDQSAPFVRPTGKRRNSGGNGDVEATAESSELVCANGRFLFDGQPGDDLAHITIDVHDLIDTVSTPEQLGAVQSRGATDLRGSGFRRRFFNVTDDRFLLDTKGGDQLLQEQGHAEFETCRG